MGLICHKSWDYLIILLEIQQICQARTAFINTNFIRKPTPNDFVDKQATSVP